MRVIAGKYRGRKLANLKGTRVRPTADRVKEAMFSILGPRLAGATVLDLCCGTGGLGIEALSRGAERVIFVDESPASLEQAQRNLDLVGAGADRYALIRADAVAWWSAWSAPAGSWFLLSDPPYAKDIAQRILSGLAAKLPADGFGGAILEHGRHELPETDLQGTASIEARRYGNCAVTIVRPAAIHHETPSGGEEHE